jgi:hypothetical protein
LGLVQTHQLREQQRAVNVMLRQRKSDFNATAFEDHCYDRVIFCSWEVCMH